MASTLETSRDVLREFNLRHELGFARRMRPLLVLLLVIVAWQLIPMPGYYDPSYYLMATPREWYGPFCFVSTQTAANIAGVMWAHRIMQELLILPGMLLCLGYVPTYRVPDEIRLTISDSELQQGATGHLRRHCWLYLGVIFVLPLLAIPLWMLNFSSMPICLLPAVAVYLTICLIYTELLVLGWQQRLDLSYLVIGTIAFLALFAVSRIQLIGTLQKSWDLMRTLGSTHMPVTPDQAALKVYLIQLSLLLCLLVPLLFANRRISTLSRQSGAA